MGFLVLSKQYQNHNVKPTNPKNSTKPKVILPDSFSGFLWSPGTAPSQSLKGSTAKVSSEDSKLTKHESAHSLFRYLKQSLPVSVPNRCAAPFLPKHLTSL